MKPEKENELLKFRGRFKGIKFYKLSFTHCPLHSCDYLNKSSIKTNVATDEGNSQNEM